MSRRAEGLRWFNFSEQQIKERLGSTLKCSNTSRA